jgi:peptidoglycan-associated lipoprotein
VGAATPAFAQNGTLKVKVKPKTGYTLVDGQPYGQGKRTVSLSAGEHEVGIYRYGHKPYTERVNIAAGQTTNLDVTLEPIGAPVAGPWGRIRLMVNPNHTGVFLNGTTPDFLVGCTGATDTAFIVHQELLVPPGTHDITLALNGYQTYTTSVTVEANQRVEVRHNMQSGSGQGTIPASAQTAKQENRLANRSNIPREKTGFASMHAAIAAVSGQFAGEPTQINCGDTSRLSWSSSEAALVEISEVGTVATSGEQLVEPHATTTYNFTAAGPSGRVQDSVTVNVNTEVVASLSVSPAEIRFRKIGDRIVEHGTANVNWSTSNADSVSVDPLGSVSASGDREVQPTPQQTDIGPVSETVSYNLNATNVCGGSATQTASLTITGSIEPIPEVVLASVFFPTDYPEERNLNLGLVASQKRALSLLVDGFNKYLEYDPDARLLLEAHADERRSAEYNRGLSERRAGIVKQYLVDAGLAGDKVASQAFGEDQNLERSEVESLEEQNPSAEAAPRRVRSKRADWLAHNRRVDIVLRPSGDRSDRYYPHNADDSNILWQVPKPSRRRVEAVQ